MLVHWPFEKKSLKVIPHLKKNKKLKKLNKIVREIFAISFLKFLNPGTAEIQNLTLGEKLTKFLVISHITSQKRFSRTEIRANRHIHSMIDRKRRLISDAIHIERYWRNNAYAPESVNVLKIMAWSDRTEID